MLNLNSEQVIIIIFKVQYSNESTRSFSKAMKITNNIKFQSFLLSSISEYITKNSEHYEELEVKRILFEYMVLGSPLSDPKFNIVREYIENDLISKNIIVENNIITEFSFLPKTMNL